MPSPSQYIFSDKEVHQKKLKNAPKTKNIGSKTSKEKCSKKPYHNKQKKDISCSLSLPNNVISVITTIKPILKLEKASL